MMVTVDLYSICCIFFTEPTSEAAKTVTLSVQREPEVLVAASSPGSIDNKQSEFRARVLLIHAHDTREDALQVGFSCCAGHLPYLRCWICLDFIQHTIPLLTNSLTDRRQVLHTIRSCWWEYHFFTLLLADRK